MAKKSIIEREKRRRKLVEQYAQRRAELMKVVKDPETDLDEKAAAYRELAKLPRDSSRTRVHNRCAITGRPRAYFRRFALSRIMLRDLAHRGELPGVRKSSW